MELTGKCKEDFEKWFILDFNNRIPAYLETKYAHEDLKEFSTFNDSMQYGVYVDFFDSVGIRLECIYDSYSSNEWYVGINCISQKGSFKLRTDARTEAIKKANEIYNN